MGRKPNTVVGDLENHIGPGGTQGDLDLSLAATRKCVLQRIGDQLIDDQPARDRGVHAEGNVFGMNLEDDVVGVHTVRGKRCVCESLEVSSDLDAAEVSRLIELFMEQRDGAHAILALLEQRDRLRIGELIHLEVEHAGDDLEVVLDSMVDLLEQDLLLFQRRPKSGLDQLSVRDVPDRRRYEHALFGLNRAEADLDRELAAVAAQTEELQPGPHRPYPRIGEEPTSMASVSTPEAVGHQCLDWHAQEVLARVLEEPLCLSVDNDDRAFAIDDDDRIWRGFEEASKLRFNFLSCRGVSNDADDQGARLGLQRAQADFDGELAAILAASREFSAFPHGTGVGLAKIVVAVAGMVLSEALGNQSLDLHAEQLLTGVPEQALGKLVDNDDVARPIDDDDRIGCSFEKPLERHRARETKGRQVRAVVTHRLNPGCDTSP